MIYHTLLTCSLTVVLVISGQRYSKSVQGQSRLGYSTNIVHTYPGVNDLRAESSIKVNLQPQQSLAGHNSRGGTKFTTTNNPDYARKSFSSPPKSSGLFNVGYDISFNNNNYRKKEQLYTHVNSKKFENAEVITGRLKTNEKVRAPGLKADITPQEFVSNAFLKQNQQGYGSTRYTSSPITTKVSSTKHVAPVREHISKYPSQSSTFTYNTQQNIFKDLIKATRPEPIQLGPDFKTSYETRSRLKNYPSSTVTSQKTEPQKYDKYFSKTRGAKYTNVPIQKPPQFNHDVALKNSESFDFSNAHGDISFGDPKDIMDNSPAGSEHYSEKVNSYDVHEHANANNNNLDSNLHPQQTSDINNLNIEAHIPKNLQGIKPLPLDTSLLKEPVLTTTFKEPSNNARELPIHFDIRQIQTAMQKELGQIQNFAAYQNPYGNQQIQSYGYSSQQNYAQPPNPTNEGLSYEDHATSPTQTHYQTFGKPGTVNNNQYNAGFNYGKEQANYEEDIYKIVSMRPPPISQSHRY